MSTSAERKPARQPCAGFWHGTGASGLAAEAAVGDQVIVIPGRVRADAPPVYLGEAGLKKVSAVEEPGDLGAGAQGERGGGVRVEGVGEGSGPLRVDVAGAVRDRH